MTASREERGGAEDYVVRVSLIFVQFLFNRHKKHAVCSCHRHNVTNVAKSLCKHHRVIIIIMLSCHDVDSLQVFMMTVLCKPRCHDLVVYGPVQASMSSCGLVHASMS